MSSPESIIENCSNCSTAIDVTASDPFALVSCPACHTNVRVRSQFNQFVIQNPVGEGGMSEVFRAWDTTLEREVAIKILNRRYGAVSERIEQFENEARLTASISHPNVVRVYSVGKDQGLFYIAMELVEGGSLDEKIQAQGKLAPVPLAEMAVQSVEGLNAAHKVGLIHRDIKPGNILFSKDGTAKIVDFGLALIADGTKEKSGEVWATPYYVAPEALTNKPEDFRSDMYSLGATLFHAISGDPAHKVETTSIKELHSIKSKQVKLSSRDATLPLPLCQVIDRMMERDPGRRHSSYERLLEDWRTCAGALGSTMPAGPSAIPQRVPKKQSSLPLVLSLVGLGLVLAIGGFFLLKGGGDGGTGEIVGPNGISTELTGEGGANISAQYLAARQDLLAGHPRKAASAFTEVATMEAVPIETMCWSRVNAAIGHLLDGRNAGAKDQFRLIDTSLADDSGDTLPGDISFFRNLRKELTANMQVGADNVTHETSGPQAVAPLILGLRAWNLGAYEEAMRLFSKFRTLDGGTTAPWIKEYHQLLDPYYSDSEHVATVMTETRNLDLTGVESVLEIVAKARDSVLTKGRLPEALKRKTNALNQQKIRLEQNLTANSEARLEQIHEEEVDELVTLLKALDELKEGYRFEEATSILAETKFVSPEINTAMEDHIYLWDQAEGFLEQLVDDFNDDGYEGPIPGTGSGSTLSGKVIEASREELVIELESGEARVSLAKLQPSDLLSLARHFIEPERNSIEFYRRFELMIAFAQQTGQEAIAGQLSKTLMQENRAFRNRWLRVRESVRGG